MKKFIAIITVSLGLAVAANAQTPTKGIDQMPGKGKTAEEQGKHEEKKDHSARANDLVSDKTEYPIKRGAAIGSSKKVKLDKLLKDPKKYEGQTVRVEGVIVRSCKGEGCWMELATKKDKPTVRVQMKSHGFFIPLNAAGLKAKAEGMVTIKTLPKEQVDHLMNEDGAKFEKINADGTVTEISFEATGVELKKS